MYDLLAAHATDRIDVGGAMPAYKMGALDAYLAEDGEIFCAHKQSLHTITKARRPCMFKAPAGARCGCKILLPRRMSHIQLCARKPR